MELQKQVDDLNRLVSAILILVPGIGAMVPKGFGDSRREVLKLAEELGFTPAI